MRNYEKFMCRPLLKVIQDVSLSTSWVSCLIAAIARKPKVMLCLTCLDASIISCLNCSWLQISNLFPLELRELNRAHEICSDRTGVSRHIETYCARAALERRLEHRLELRLASSHFPGFLWHGRCRCSWCGEAAGEAPAAEVALTLVTRPLRLWECSWSFSWTWSSSARSCRLRKLFSSWLASSFSNVLTCLEVVSTSFWDSIVRSREITSARALLQDGFHTVASWWATYHLLHH